MRIGGIRQWWYEQDGQAKGPVGAEEIQLMVSRGRLNHASQIIVVGSSRWSTIGELAVALGLTDLDRRQAAPAPAPAVAQTGGFAPSVVDDRPVAAAGVRLGSALLDVVLISCTFMIGWIIWSILIWPQGLTPAKQIVGGLRVVDIETRQPATTGKMALRELVGKLLLWTASFGITIIVSAFMIIFGDSRRAIWDRIANTVVIDERGRGAVRQPRGQGASPRRTGWALLGTAFGVFFVAGLSGQNGSDPDQERFAIVLLVVAAGFFAVGLALLLKSASERAPWAPPPLPGRWDPATTTTSPSVKPWPADPQFADPASHAGVPPQSGVDSTAVAALVLGIASVPFFLFPLLPILAIVLGLRGRRNVTANPAKTGRGMATAGVVLGVVGLVLLAGFLALVGASDQS